MRAAKLLPLSWLRPSFQICVSILLLAVLNPAVVAALLENQVESPATEASTAPPAPSPSAIPLAEVVTQAETVSDDVRNLQEELSSDPTIKTIEDELPQLTKEIDARMNEGSKILASNPTLESLRNLEASWQRVSENLPEWKHELTLRATQLDREIQRLSQMQSTWSQTLVVAQTSETPPEILQRVQGVIGAISQTRVALEKRRARVLSLLNRVAEQDARVSQAVDAVRQEQDEAVNRLFVRDSPAIWSSELRSRNSATLVKESQASFSTQLTTLRSYSDRQFPRFLLHLAIILLLVLGLHRGRHKIRPLLEQEPELKPAALIFYVPVPAAIVLSMMLAGWIYPEAPRLLRVLLGAVALIPTVIILKRLIESYLFPILYALVVFYFFDLLRTVSASLAILSRTLFLVETLSGVLFLIWFVRFSGFGKSAAQNRDVFSRAVTIGARTALTVLALAFGASALGYVNLANLAGSAVLGSSYIAVILYAAERIAEGFVVLGLRSRPLNRLGMVREHRPLIQRRWRRLLRWLGLFLWAWYTLQLLSLRALLIEDVRQVLSATLSVGSLKLSLWNVFAFVITLWAAFLVSRFICFVLEEEIYPHVSLARGLPYAISTVLHYAILLLGFFAAVAALGFDMTRFTILAGAFGVGLGFGLQNILNNFVSGLILLFERPVKVGDVIQISDGAGVVERIGIRASVIRTSKGSEIIVPNGKLISDPVTNWTLTNQQRGIEIPVGVAYGTDPERVIELLREVARNHPKVCNDPAPQPVFIAFGTDSLNFELRVWTDNYDEWVQIRSDLAVAINSIFDKEKISIPNPQRDLHLRSIDPEALKAVLLNGSGQPRRIGPEALEAGENSEQQAQDQ